MKMKKFWAGGGRASLAPPVRSATVRVLEEDIWSTSKSCDQTLAPRVPNLYSVCVDRSCNVLKGTVDFSTARNATRFALYVVLIINANSHHTAASVRKDVPST